MSENLAYKFTPAGHEQPEERRKYEQVDAQLAKEFENWLAIAGPLIDDRDREHEKETFFAGVFERLKKMPTASELHALLIKHQDKAYLDLHASEFLNRLYNHIDEKVILYDLDAGANFWFLAQRLDSEKVFINKVKLGYEFGHSAKGTIINYADDEKGSSVGILLEGKFLNYGNLAEKLGGDSTYNSLCINAGNVEDLSPTASGLIINFGKAKQFGEEATDDSLLINVGDAEFFGKSATGRLIAIKSPANHDSESEMMLNEEQCKEIPKLKRYFDALRKKVEAGRTDHQAAIKLMKTLSREKIEADLERIVTDAGEYW